MFNILKKDSRTILFGLFLTLMNIIYSFYLGDFVVFVIRQIFLVVFLWPKDDFHLISEEDQKIRCLLVNKYPIFRFEFPLLLIIALIFLVQVNYPFFDEVYLILSFSFLFFSLLYSILIFYQLLCTLSTPELKHFYDIKTSIKIYGFRSFSTSAKVMHACKLCFKVGSGGLGLIWVVPKVVHEDLFYRGDLWNSLTYLFTEHKIKVKSSLCMMNANHFLNYYPEDKALVTNEDGCTINPLKL